MVLPEEGETMSHSPAVLLRAFLALFLLCTLTSLAAAQNATLSGTVKDQTNGEALPGANIQVKSASVQRGDVAATRIDILPAELSIWICFARFHQQ